MSADDTRDRAAKRLLTGKERIQAKAKALPPVQAAREQYGDDALETVQDAMEASDVELTDDLLAAIRSGDDDVAAELSAATADPSGSGADSGSDDGDDRPDAVDDINGAEVMTASEFLQEKNERRERLEADNRPTDDVDDEADQIALQVMDGDDRVESDARGLSPSDYIRDEYGLDPAEFDSVDDLQDAITDQQGGGST
jgi:hypothetical protein